MGKKGKGNKLAKMSEEERVRYLQMRADIEEEARRRKIQLLSLYMKNKLKREDAFCRLNLAKINQEWRSLLRQVKCQELRNEILVLERSSKEELERKERIIKSLLADLDIAEDQHSTLQEAHTETVDKMINIQQAREAFFSQLYKENKNEVLQECREHFKKFGELRMRSQQQLEALYQQVEDTTLELFQKKHERHLERIDDIKSTFELQLEEITKTGEGKLERLWQEYQEVLADYVRRTEDFYAEYMDLKERDDESSNIRREYRNEIERATEQLAHLKLLGNDIEEKSAIEMGYLGRAHSELAARLSDMKQKVDKEISTAEQKFTLMSVESHNALKDLKSIAQQGETLLQQAAICRKLESEREILAPLGLPPLSRKFLERTDEEMQQEPEGLRKQSLGQWWQMEKFWRRVNNAAIDVSDLKEQQKALQAENAHFREKLQEYLLNLNLANGSNLHVNDYLAQRPQSMRVDRVQHLQPGSRQQSQSAGDLRRGKKALKPRPITAYVEANFSSAVRGAQLAKGRMKLAKIEAIANW